MVFARHPANDWFWKFIKVVWTIFNRINVDTLKQPTDVLHFYRWLTRKKLPQSCIQYLRKHKRRRLFHLIPRLARRMMHLYAPHGRWTTILESLIRTEQKNSSRFPLDDWLNTSRCNTWASNAWLLIRRKLLKLFSAFSSPRYYESD